MEQAEAPPGRASWLRPYDYKPRENNHTRLKALRDSIVDKLHAKIRETYGREPDTLEMLRVGEIAENLTKKNRTARDQNTVDRLMRRLFKPTPRRPRTFGPQVTGRQLSAGRPKP